MSFVYSRELCASLYGIFITHTVALCVIRAWRISLLLKGVARKVYAREDICDLLTCRSAYARARLIRERREELACRGFDREHASRYDTISRASGLNVKLIIIY